MQTSSFPTRTLVGRQASACGLLRAVVAVLTITFVGNSIAYGQDAAPPVVTNATLLKIGVSKQVKVKEANGTKVKGTVAAINDDSFLVSPKDGGAAITIPYAQAGEVERSGLSKGAIIALCVVAGIAIVVAVLIAVVVAKGPLLKTGN
jgi:hypothetical protein